MNPNSPDRKTSSRTLISLRDGEHPQNYGRIYETHAQHCLLLEYRLASQQAWRAGQENEPSYWREFSVPIAGLPRDHHDHLGDVAPSIAIVPSLAHVHPPATPDGTMAPRNTEIVLYSSHGNSRGSHESKMFLEVLPLMRPTRHETRTIQQIGNKGWLLATTTPSDKRRHLSGQTLHLGQNFHMQHVREDVRIRRWSQECWRLFNQLVGSQVSNTLPIFDACHAEDPRYGSERINDENIHRQFVQSEHLAKTNTSLTEELSSLRETISVLNESFHQHRVDNLAILERQERLVEKIQQNQNVPFQETHPSQSSAARSRPGSQWYPCSLGCISASGQPFQNEFQQLWTKTGELESIDRQIQRQTTQAQREQTLMMETLDTRMDGLRAAEAHTKISISDLEAEAEEQRALIRSSHVRYERRLIGVEQDYEDLSAKLAEEVMLCKQLNIQQAHEFEAQITTLRDQWKQDHQRLLSGVVTELPKDALFQKHRLSELPNLQPSAKTLQIQPYPVEQPLTPASVKRNVDSAGQDSEPTGRRRSKRLKMASVNK